MCHTTNIHTPFIEIETVCSIDHGVGFWSVSDLGDGPGYVDCGKAGDYGLNLSNNSWGCATCMIKEDSNIIQQHSKVRETKGEEGEEEYRKRKRERERERERECSCSLLPPYVLK